MSVWTFLLPLLVCLLLFVTKDGGGLICSFHFHLRRNRPLLATARKFSPPDVDSSSDFPGKDILHSKDGKIGAWVIYHINLDLRPQIFSLGYHICKIYGHNYFAGVIILTRFAVANLKMGLTYLQDLRPQIFVGVVISLRFVTATPIHSGAFNKGIMTFGFSSCMSTNTMQIQFNKPEFNKI